MTAEAVDAPREHWCVAYAGQAGLRTAAGRHLPAGLSDGEQVGLFGWGTPTALRQALADLDAVDDLLDRGAVRIGVLDDRFQPSAPPEPTDLVAYWADATQRALDSGFRGLRVVADTTPWAKLHDDERAVFLRGEQLINRQRSTQRFTLICACDATVLSEHALQQTARIHPLTDGVDPSFRLYAAGATDVALHGEVDALTVPDLLRLLDTVPLADPVRGLVVDASGLEFIEHRGLLALEHHAERTALRAVTLHGASPTAARIAELLDLRRVRVETVR